MTDVVLISTDWLAQNLNAPNQRIVDLVEQPVVQRDSWVDIRARPGLGVSVRREVLECNRC